MTDLPSGTVAFLFTDIEGSTRAWEYHPEAMRPALERQDALLRRSVHAHRGHVFKTIGDAYCAAFHTPAEALAAALTSQQELLVDPPGEEGPLRVRMALNVGAAELHNGDYLGPALNRVARLLGVGHGGQVLVSQAVYDLVRDALPEGAELRDLGEHSLKDLQQRMRVYQLLHPSLPADFPPLLSLDVLPNNLPPQLTTFVGREREMAEIKRLLAGTRLLTLTGAAGSGKTRLALQAAAERLEDYPDGVWLVELATLAEASLVPQAVASALTLREQSGRPLTDSLVDFLKPRKVLLVLDNCEHLLEACGQLAALLLRACPGVKLLATSREPLNITGEVAWPVPPLAAPDPRLLPPRPAELLHALNEYEAVRLFIDRASVSKPDFAVTERNATALAQICHRLDGIPLAIELAAARVKALSVEQVAARLDDRFRLLTGGSRTLLPRHQTLRAAMDWSYELLSDPERVLLRRLSVFAGGWPLEAAEAVCQGEGIEEWEVLELQAHLVDKSLIVVGEGVGGETRYRLLGTIRQYAGDRLVEAGEAARVRDHHRDWFLELAEQAATQLRGPDQAVWLERLEQEHDNLRAALEWSQAQPEGAEAGLRLAGALYRFWSARDYLTEGRQWFEGALSADGAATTSSPRAEALRGAGWLAVAQADFTKGRVLLEQSLAMCRELGDKHSLVQSLNALANLELEQNYERAQPLFEEGLSLAREIDAKDLIPILLNNVGEIARIRGDYEEARRLYQQAVDGNREIGNRLGTAIGLLNLGFVAYTQEDYAAAHSFFEQSLAIMRELGGKVNYASCLEGLAAVYAAQGQAERAARLLGAAETVREIINAPRSLADRPNYDRSVATTRSLLGEKAFVRLWADGRALTLERAISLATEETDPDGLDRATSDEAARTTHA
jgi:predicted ATPase/class 3 adenylate cyclase